jgi:hypothetical protein
LLSPTDILATSDLEILNYYIVAARSVKPVDDGCKGKQEKGEKEPHFFLYTS